MAKKGEKDEYSLSEVARELGVTRQSVHDSVKRCANPYKPKKTGRPKHPEVEVISCQWVCPVCKVKHSAIKKATCHKCKKVSTLKRE